MTLLYSSSYCNVLPMYVILLIVTRVIQLHYDQIKQQLFSLLVNAQVTIRELMEEVT